MRGVVFLFAFTSVASTGQADIPEIIENLAHPDPDVSAAAVTEIGDDTSREQVYDMIEDYIVNHKDWKDPLKLSRIKQGLVTLAMHEQAVNVSPMVAPTLESLLKEIGRPAEELKAAASLLRAIGPPASYEAMPVLIEILENREEPPLVRELLLVIRESGKAPEALTQLAHATGHENPITANHAVHTLQEAGLVDEALAELIQLLHDEKGAVRLTAARGLSGLELCAAEPLVDALIRTFEAVENWDHSDVLFVKTAVETLHTSGQSAEAAVASALKKIQSEDAAENLRRVHDHLLDRITLVKAISDMPVTEKGVLFPL